MKLRTRLLSHSQRRWLAPLFVAGVMGALLTACGGGYDGGSTSANIVEAPLPEDTATRLQGYVSQTRVVGAQVWVDRDFDERLDADETFEDATSSSGLFTLDLNSLDESSNYQLVSSGGTARALTATAENVGVMLAPRGARNITPLTTLVALNSNLRSLLEATIGESYDTDIAHPNGVSASTLQIAKGVEVFMYVFGPSSEGLLTSVDDQIQALTLLANQLSTNGISSESVRDAVDDVFANVATLQPSNAAQVATLKSQIYSAVNDVVAAIPNSTGPVTEASILSACHNAFATTDLIQNGILSSIRDLNIQTVSGRVVQSYVNGATVFLDFDGDLVQDNDEPVVTTGSDGSYTLRYDATDSPTYQLVSVGGTKTDALGNNEPASLMLAPQGASNITLLTTLVTLDPDLEAKLGSSYDADLASSNGVDASLLRIAKVVESYAQAFSTSNSPYFLSAQDQQQALGLLANELDNTFGGVGQTALTSASAADFKGVISSTVANVETTFGIDVDPTLQSVLENTAFQIAGNILGTGTVTESSYQYTVDSYLNTLQTSVAGVPSIASNPPSLSVENLSVLDVYAGATNEVVNTPQGNDALLEYGIGLDNFTFTMGSSDLAVGENVTINNFSIGFTKSSNTSYFVVPALTVSRTNSSSLSFSYDANDNLTIVGPGSTSVYPITDVFGTDNNSITLSLTNVSGNAADNDNYTLSVAGVVEGIETIFDNRSIEVHTPQISVSEIQFYNTSGNSLDNDTGANDNVSLQTAEFVTVDNITLLANVDQLYDNYSYTISGAQLTLDNSTANVLTVTFPEITVTRAGSHPGLGHASEGGNLSIVPASSKLTIGNTEYEAGLTGSTDNSSNLTFSYTTLRDSAGLDNLTPDNYTIEVLNSSFEIIEQ